MSASDFKFVPNSNPSEFDPSEPVIVSHPSPMSDGSGSPLLVRCVSGSDQCPSSDPIHHDQQGSEVVIDSEDLQSSSSGLTDQLHTVVIVDGIDTGPVVVVGAVPQALYLVIDASGSMRKNVPKVIKSVDLRTEAANNAGIPVTMVIFSDKIDIHEFEAGKCPRLTGDLYKTKGDTALNRAMSLTLQKIASMPIHFQLLCELDSDGEDTEGGVTTFELHQQVSALRRSHPGFSGIMCSSGPGARKFASDIGLEPNQVIHLDESCREFGAKALYNAQNEFFRSDLGSIASFDPDDIVRSEQQTDNPMQWPSHGSSYVDNDCVPTPGPNVSYWNGSGRANDDFQSEH
jgi:hypothetical protein